MIKEAMIKCYEGFQVMFLSSQKPKCMTISTLIIPPKCAFKTLSSVFEHYLSFGINFGGVLQKKKLFAPTLSGSFRSNPSVNTLSENGDAKIDKKKKTNLCDYN